MPAAAWRTKRPSPPMRSAPKAVRTPPGMRAPLALARPASRLGESSGVGAVSASSAASASAPSRNSTLSRNDDAEPTLAETRRVGAPGPGAGTITETCGARSSGLKAPHEATRTSKSAREDMRDAAAPSCLVPANMGWRGEKTRQPKDRAPLTCAFRPLETPRKHQRDGARS